MQLHKLVPKDIQDLYGRQIYCYEYSPSYFIEMSEKYGIGREFKIEAVIDAGIRNQGVHDLFGRKLVVYGHEYLAECELENAVFIITSDYHNEAYERLSRLLADRGYSGDIYYFENRETGIEMEYRRRYENQPLKNIIIFRSGPHASAYIKGMDFGDNARALFDYMLAEGYNEKYELVWLVKEPEEFSRYNGTKNVRFLSFDWPVSGNKAERDAYYGALCLAKYIFFTDAYGFARNCRMDQTRVQLWHGCGFKTRVNFVRCGKRYEYMTVISDLYSEIHKEVYGLREDQMLVTGCAKQDWLFSPAPDWREKLDIPRAGKYIFWLPTFRMAKEGLANLNEYESGGPTYLPVVDTLEKLRALNQLLAEKEAVLVVKPHPFQDSSEVIVKNLSNLVFLDNDRLYETDIQTNMLLASADALISDYSSAAVDYLLLDRPIGFTLDDVKEYEDSRGFVFESLREWLPGSELYTFEDICGFIKEVCAGEDSTKEKRGLLLKTMHKYRDNKNCKRIIDSLGI